MSQDWYYFQNGSQVGPVSESVILEMLQSGRLRWDDLVWREGLSDWLPAEQIPDLASSRVVQSPAAAPVPPPFRPPAAAPVVTAPPPAFQPQAAAVPAQPVQPLSAIPPLSPSAPAAPMSGGVSQGTVLALAKTRPWVRLFGVLTLIGCILMVLGGLAGLAMGVMGTVSTEGGLAGVGIGAAALLVYLVAAAFIFPVALFLNRYAKGIRILQSSGRTEDLERALLAQKSYWKYAGVLTLVWIILSVLGVAAMLIFGLSGYLTSSY